MDKQKTISKEFSFKGVGLHTGKEAKAVFKPAAVDSGINFTRVDLADKPVIKASVENLVSAEKSPRRTSICRGQATVQTIEHAMAALCALGIDNIIIEIDNQEMPGLDGSALNYIEAIEASGIVEQEKERLSRVIKEPIVIEEGNSSIVAYPAEEFKISYTLSYLNPLPRNEFLEIKLNAGTFKKEIASSRTFCLESEAQLLQSQGIGLGANYTNTLVLGKDGVINNTLRYQDEFVRHKILDLIGDLYLTGGSLKAHIVALRSGHSLNLKLAQKIALAKPPLKLSGELDINDIMKILPHREPFLFVDRITNLEKGKRATGIKNVTINDYFFRGHFPGKPVMPGVIIVEAMAQVGGIMMLASEENRGKLAYFMAVDKVKFRKVVVPGDQLVFEVEAGKIRSRTGQVFGKAFVDGKLAAEAELMFALGEY